jgi:trimeric autotransporter adhesin
MKAFQAFLPFIFICGLAAGLSACENWKIMGALNPGISTMTPTSVAAGTAQFSIQITGSDFTIGVQIFFNGSPRPTSGFSVNGVVQQISGAIFASDVAMPGTAQITVVNPGGRMSNAMTLTITPGPNPLPSIASVSPASAAAGAPDQQINALQVTVNGTNFVPLSQIFLGDELLRVTKFDSDMQLEATIPVGLLMKSGQMPITVRTPEPGGGTSNPVPFEIR